MSSRIHITALAVATVAAALGSAAVAPAEASINVSYTVESDTPNVSIAYAPGQWQDYRLEYSNLAGRYGLTLNTTPATRPTNMYIAAKGSGGLHCRIRVSGAVVAVDNAPGVVVCRS